MRIDNEFIVIRINNNRVKHTFLALRKRCMGLDRQTPLRVKEFFYVPLSLTSAF